MRGSETAANPPKSYFSIDAPIGDVVIILMVRPGTPRRNGTFPCNYCLRVVALDG